jgi:methionyl-tRNA formyltransferase
MTPWPGARTTPPDGRELVVLRAPARPPAELEPALGSLEPGTLAALGGRPFARAGEGALELLELKPSGKRAMSGEDFLRGAHLATPLRLGAA